MIKQCIYCGKEFELKSPTQKYCSKECFRKVHSIENRKYYQDNKDWFKEYYKNYYKEPSPKKSITKKCVICGEEFKAVQNSQIYCSEKCRRKAYYQRNREKILTRQKQYRKDHLDYYQNYNKKYYQDHKDYFMEYRKNRKCFQKQRLEYPCYKFTENTLFKIPTNMCLTCNTERCRFDHD